MMPATPLTPEDIKSNMIDIRPCFESVYSLIFEPEEKCEAPDICYVSKQILDFNSLDQFISNENLAGKQYALLFYAHKPWNPNFPRRNETSAHTSLLLCGVGADGKIDINKVMSIDSYHYLPYVDLLGEGVGRLKNKQKAIKKRYVICYKNEGINKPIQHPSWSNMNCAIYAANFAKSLLIIIEKKNADIIDNAFKPNENENPASSILRSHGGESELVTAIIDELLIMERYFEKSRTGIITYNSNKALDYHTQVREKIAGQCNAVDSPVGSPVYNSDKWSERLSSESLVKKFFWNIIYFFGRGLSLGIWNPLRSKENIKTHTDTSYDSISNIIEINPATSPKHSAKSVEKCFDCFSPLFRTRMPTKQTSTATVAENPISLLSPQPRPQ